MNNAKAYRLRFIDFVLDHYGRLNRSTIEEYFGISSAQSSLDIQAYKAMAPRNTTYDATEKCYVRSPKFKRVLP